MIKIFGIDLVIKGFIRLALLAGMSAVAYGKIAEVAPEAKEWSSSLDLSEMKDITFPRKILILESLDTPIPTAIAFNDDMCEENSFVTCANAANFDYTLKLNKLPTALKPTDCMKYSDANVVLFNSGKGITLAAGNKPETIQFSKAGKLNDKLNPAKILKHLFSVLGYDGVVLAEKSPFILVGSTKAKLKKEHLQGILIEDSSTEWQLAEKSASAASSKKSGAALIELQNTYGGYGVFRLLAQDSEASVKIGQKVVVEH
jgi:hypothetical protein